MAGEALGVIRGQMILDVRQALTAYTQARQAHVATVVALHTGAGAMIQAGAGIAAVGTAMVAGFGMAVKAAADFEKRLDFFGAVSASTAEEMEAVRQKALELGADTIYSANQIAESFIELGKSGVAARDIIDGIGEGVASLGAAADIPLDTAANIIMAAVATFQLGADQAVMVADRLAGAANASIIGVEDLGVSLKYVGGVAASLRIPFEDVNTALAILGESGIKGSTAGTSLRQVLLGLNGSTAKAKDALKELGIITADGANKFFTAEGKAKSLAEVFQILQDATAGMTDKQRTATMQQIFAVRALPSLIALTRAGADGFADMAEAIGKTTALEVASARLDNLSGDIEILRGNIDTLLIESGTGFQDFARFVVQSITEIIQALLELPNWAQTAITATLASFGGIAVIVGTLGMLAGAILNIVALGEILGPVFAALGAAFVAFRTAMIAAWAVMAANPVTLVIGILLALAAAFITLYQTSEGFRNAVQPLFDGLMSIFQTLQPIITTVMGNIAQFFGTLVTAGAPVLARIVEALGQLASTLGGVLQGALAAVLPPILEVVGIFMNGLMPVITMAIPLLETLGQIISAVFGGDMASIPALMDQLANNFQGFIGAIAQGLLPAIIQIGTNIIVGIINMVPQIIIAGQQLMISLITAIAGALPGIITAGVQIITTLITTIVSMIPTLIQTGLQLILSLLTALTSMLPMLIQAGVSLITGLLQGITTVLPMIIEAVVTIIPMLIMTLVQMLPLLIEAAITLFLGLVQGLTTALPQIITALIDAVILLITSLVEMLPMLIEAAITLFLGLITGLSQALPQIITAVIEAIPKLVSALISMIPLIIQAAIQLFLGLIQGLARALPQIIAAVVAMIPKIVSALQSGVGQLVQAGVQLIQGLIDGIMSMVGNVIAAAQDVASGAVNAVKNFLGIASPSKVFIEIGAFLIQGLANGILGMQRTAVNAATAVADAVASVPFELSGLQEMYDTVRSGQLLSARLDGSQMGVESSQLLTLNDRMNEQPPANVTWDVDIINPEPEPASDSLPRMVRKVAYMME